MPPVAQGLTDNLAAGGLLTGLYGTAHGLGHLGGERDGDVSDGAVRPTIWVPALQSLDQVDRVFQKRGNAHQTLPAQAVHERLGWERRTLQRGALLLSHRDNDPGLQVRQVEHEVVWVPGRTRRHRRRP